MTGPADLSIGVRHLQNGNQYLPMVYQREHKIKIGVENSKRKSCARYVSQAEVDSVVR